MLKHLARSTRPKTVQVSECSLADATTTHRLAEDHGEVEAWEVDVQEQVLGLLCLGLQDNIRILGATRDTVGSDVLCGAPRPCGM